MWRRGQGLIVVYSICKAAAKSIHCSRRGPNIPTNSIILCNTYCGEMVYNSNLQCVRIYWVLREEKQFDDTNVVMYKNMWAILGGGFCIFTREWNVLAILNKIENVLVYRDQLTLNGLL